MLYLGYLYFIIKTINLNYIDYIIAGVFSFNIRIIIMRKNTTGMI